MKKENEYQNLIKKTIIEHAEKFIGGQEPFGDGLLRDYKMIGMWNDGVRDFAKYLIKEVFNNEF